MNHTVRATIVASVTAAAAALFFIPSAAVAAEGTFILTSHQSRDVLTPGQTIAGTVPLQTAFNAWEEGDEFVLRGNGFNSGSSVLCDPVNPVIASGVIGAGGAFSVTMTGTAPDDTIFIGICNDSLAKNGGFPSAVLLQNPFELSSHGEGGAVDVSVPVVAGKGSPGSTVEARDEDGASLGSAVVGADGTWTLTLEGVVQGPTKITFAQGEKSFESSLVMVDESETTPLVDPVIGGSAAAVLGLGAVALLRRRARTTV